MVPDQKMSLKMGKFIPMDISPTVVKKGPVKLSDGIKDYVFDNGTSSGPREKVIVACSSGICQNNTMNMEIGHDQTMANRGCNGVEEVDIVGGWNPSKEAVVGRNSMDVTEESSSSSSSLSSFGSTGSGAENVASSNDVEVESSSMGEVNASSLFGFGGFGGLLGSRKKRLTPKWRKFIDPWMKRCKWVELRIREIESQAAKYERELAECYRRKQSEWEKYAAEDCCIKTVPFGFHNQPVKLMKWKRRKRVEETVDLASYTKSHELFSYFANRKCVGGFVTLDEDDDRVKDEKAPIDDDFFGVKGGLSTLDIKHSDAFESILRKIEEGQSQVRQLRVRIDKVVAENTGKFTAEDSSIPLFNQSASFVPNPVSSALDDESLHASLQASFEELSPLENVVLDDGEETLLPNLVENTGHPLTCEYMENGTLTNDDSVKQERNNSEEVRSECIAESSRARDSEATNIESPKSCSKTSTIIEEKQTVKAGDDSQKNKRKRGRRKARLGRWNRKSSG